jgi:hypothetical protein
MKIKSRLVGFYEINGKPVSFFTPPHDEPDFLWVDVAELANAFLPPDAADLMLKHAHDFDRENRPVATALKGEAIVTVMCHAMAQGMCGAIDQAGGYHKAEDEWGGGPVETAYSVAMGRMMYDHWRLPISELGRALQNQGGPFMRGLK